MRVEESISDVKELLQQRKPDVWEEEWETAVQDLLRQDAGWGYVGYFIIHNSLFVRVILIEICVLPSWPTFWEMLRLNVEDCIVSSRIMHCTLGPSRFKLHNTSID